jgi:hypothetical protein
MPLRRRRDLLRAGVLDRINSVVHQRTRSIGFVSSSDEAHVDKCAEPHIARAAIQSVSVNP